MPAKSPLSVEIKRISVPAGELLDKNVVLLYYKRKTIDVTQGIWTDAGARAGSIYPVAFISGKTPQLTVSIRIKNAVPGTYTLSSTFTICKNYGNQIHEDAGFKLFNGTFCILPENSNKNKKNEGKDQSKENDEQTVELDVPVTVSFDPKCFFRSTRQYTWDISGDNGLRITAQAPTYLDIFWLYDGDFSIFRKGVPVELLEYLSVVCRAYFVGNVPPKNKFLQYISRSDIIAMPTRETIVAGIVNACFYRNPPNYDYFNGNQHFSLDYQSDSKTQKVLFLHEYYEAAKAPFSLCNCDDMALVLYSHLRAVGIRRVVIHSVEAFGNFRLNNVIGRGLCNNQHYCGNHLNKIVLERQTTREGFWHHTFCTWDCGTDEAPYASPKKTGEGYGSHPGKVVLDACIGPYIGEYGIRDYLKRVQDHVRVENDDISTDIDDHQEADIHVDYLGPTKKVSEFTANIPAYDDATSDLLDTKYKTSQYFPPPKKQTLCLWPDPTSFKCIGTHWEKSFEGILVGDHMVCKTWKLLRNGEQIKIRIYVFTQNVLNESKQISHIVHVKKSHLAKVFFAVHCTNSTIAPQSILDELNLLASSSPGDHYKDKYKHEPPSLEEVKWEIYNHPTGQPISTGNIAHDDSPIIARVGQRITFRISKNDENRFMDFRVAAGSGNGTGDKSGLILTKDSDRYSKGDPTLEFLVTDDSLNEKELVLVVVDQDTLLSSSTVIKIKVQKNDAESTTPNALP